MVADAAARAVEFVGLPEAQLNLAQAVVHLACAPKSNRVTVALGRAQRDVREAPRGDVPTHLRDAHYRSASTIGHGEGYVYPHDHPDAYVDQEYRPGGGGRHPVLRAERPGPRGGGGRAPAAPAGRGPAPAGRPRPAVRAAGPAAPTGVRDRPRVHRRRRGWARLHGVSRTPQPPGGAPPRAALVAVGGRWSPVRRS